MSDPKFTPGQWRFYRCLIGSPENALNPIVTSEADGGYSNVCRLFCIQALPGMTSRAPSLEIAEANAHLISAAPDLFYAIQGVLRVADRKTDEFDAALAAIAKALGATA